MNALGIIPARWASSRFPGKPLAKIAGRPMIEHVWERSRESETLREVVIATDDSRIAEACESFGARVVMTSHTCATGTDRVAQALERMETANGIVKDDIVVNIQGDEPLMESRGIDAAVRALLADEEAVASTIVHRTSDNALGDPNRVSVFVDESGRALHFSRGSIGNRIDGRTSHWQHVGLYAYRREFLLRFAEMEATPGELAESLEQLRILENRHTLCVAKLDNWRSAPVDIPEDISEVEEQMRAAGPALACT